VRLSVAACCSTLEAHVFAIVGISAEEQVFGIDTELVVAAVADMNLWIIYGPVQKLPHEAVCSRVLSVQVEMTISTSADRTFPLPTAGRGE
jgi:hypothetical protein